jgi:hypothetical protein
LKRIPLLLQTAAILDYTVSGEVFSVFDDLKDNFFFGVLVGTIHSDLGLS